MNLFNIARTFEMQKTKGWPETYWCTVGMYKDSCRMVL